MADWHRILRPGGRVLFTDPIVVTGQLSNDEIRARRSIGFFLFTPVGHNERLLEKAGFIVRDVQDVTDGVVSVSAKWHERASAAMTSSPRWKAWRRSRLQRFLASVHALASERRLSRYMYVADK